MRESTLKKFLRMERFDEHLELHRLDCLGSHGKLSAYEMARRKLEELPKEELRPPRLLSGDDLIEAGYEPGPRFQTILSDVEDAQLEGLLSGRDQALSYVREHYPQESGKAP
jgi:poly(A) polymerase